MKTNYFLVTYQCGLQGKTHKLVVPATTVEEAWDYVVCKQDWQSPQILNVEPYVKPVLL